MKRKAMLMGMAVMASMPGWAMAKGVVKVAGVVHFHAGGTAVEESDQAVEAANQLPILYGTDRVDSAQGKTPELLAQVRNMLRGASYSAFGKPAKDTPGWTLEQLETEGRAYGYGDAHPRPAAPVGVVFRLRF